MALLVVVIVVSRRKERERTEAMERVCIEMGFVFEPQADIDLLTSLGDLPLYKRGHSRRAKNMMTGRVGDDAVKVVNFQYTTGGGQHQHTSKQTVAVFPLVTRSLPDLQLAPENVFHKLGQVFGYQDIDFESNPDFSSRYEVVREALERFLNEASAHPDSCLALASDLIGCVEGPADLSHNKKLLE